jgi:hypothetical protein
MKKVLSTTTFALLMANMAFTGCIKETSKAKPVLALWNGLFKDCSPSQKGTCTSLVEPADGRLENVKLNLNEGVGTVISTKQANGTLLTTINLT